jgi:hypothetical protein
MILRATFRKGQQVLNTWCEGAYPVEPLLVWFIFR